MQSPLVIHLSIEEQAHLENRAHQLGLSPDDYVRALIHADTEEQADIRREFIESWREARQNEGIPLNQLWDALDDE